MSKSPKSIGAKINRLTREIEEIDSYFYRANEKDDSESHAGMLERKRDDMVRGIVLQIHTAIEGCSRSTYHPCHHRKIKPSAPEPIGARAPRNSYWRRKHRLSQKALPGARAWRHHKEDKRPAAYSQQFA